MDINEIEEESFDPTKVKITFQWEKKKNGKAVTMDGDCWLITDEGLSFAAKQRAQNALMKNDLLELNLCLLTDRVRFGEDGEQKLTVARARQQVERPNPLFEALIDAAYHKIQELRGDEKKETATKN